MGLIFGNFLNMLYKISQNDLLCILGINNGAYYHMQYEFPSNYQKDLWM
jgi:hypothetical protein